MSVVESRKSLGEEEAKRNESKLEITMSSGTWDLLKDLRFTECLKYSIVV